MDINHAILYSDRITTIYEDVIHKFNHSAIVYPKNNNLLAIYFIHPDLFLNLFHDKGGAIWNRDYGIILSLNKTLNSSFTHEIIHSVTLGSPDSKCVNIPFWFREGIAQFYQNDLNNGYFSIEMIKSSINNKLIYSFSDIINPSLNTQYRSFFYNQSACIVGYLIKVYGESRVINIFYSNGDFYDNLQLVTGHDISSIENMWLDYIHSL